MIKLEIDASASILRIAFRGQVNPEQAKQSVIEMETALEKLPPDFRLLTDLTELEQMDTGCAPEIRQSMELCGPHGVGRIIRVIPDPKKDIGFNLMSIFHYDRTIPILTCKTMEEAEHALRAG